MQKKVFTLLTAVSLCVTSAVFAAETTVSKTTTKATEKAPVTKTAPAAKKAVSTMVDLYESPNTHAKVIKQISPNADLIAIFHQGDWVKVGDRKDGSTGWVHLPQYHQAKNDYYRDNFHVYVNSVSMNTYTDKNGKVIVEAYRNGKKLPDAEAQQLFNQMRAQEQRQWVAMQQDYLNAQRAMDAAFHAPMFMMPGIIVVQSPQAQNAKPSAHVKEKNEKQEKHSATQTSQTNKS